MADYETIRVEQVKLTATFLNGIAIAFIAIGALAPLVSYLSSASVVRPTSLALVMVGCLCLGVAIHMRAILHLGKMR